MTEIGLPAFAQALFQNVADDGSPVRYRVLKGGRGSAKSHSMVKALVIRARQVRLRILCCREIQKSIRDSVKALLAKTIDEMGFGVLGDGSFTVLESEIRCNVTGSLITFTGLRSNIDSVKSTEGVDIAYVTEARAVSQSSWDVLLPTIRNPGSEIWVDYNPELESDPVDAIFAGPDGPPPGTIIRHVNYGDNPWFPDVLRRQMEYDRQRDPEKYNHVWLGQHRKNSESRVFKHVRIEPVPEPPPGTVFRFGADWGYSVDPSVLVRCWIDGRTLYIDREAYQVGCETADLPKLFAGRAAEPGSEWTASDQSRWPGIEDVKRWPVVADGARPETISFLNGAGFRVTAAKKGAGSVDEGVQWLQSYDIVIDPRCTNAAYEFTTYAFKTDPRTGQVLPLLSDKNNHVIDSVRYATEGLRRKDVDYSQWG